MWQPATNTDKTNCRVTLSTCTLKIPGKLTSRSKKKEQIRNTLEILALVGSQKMHYRNEKRNK